MAKVLTFSTVFPAYHPRRGESTNFIQKIQLAFPERHHSISEINDSFGYGHIPKFHTIRAPKKHWVPGMSFSPRYWKGAPYKSPQCEFSDDIQVVQTWKLDINFKLVTLNDKYHCTTNSRAFEEIAMNDGLTVPDLLAWFRLDQKDPEPIINHQIICWSDKITY